MNCRQNFVGAFLSMPPTEGEIGNLDAGKVQLVMMPFTIARDHLTVLKRLARPGRKLVVRVEEWFYYKGGAAQEVVAGLRAIGMVIPIEAVIIGNEVQEVGNDPRKLPTGEVVYSFDMTKSSTNWGNKPTREHPQGKMFEHRFYMKAVIDAIREAGIPVKLIGPAWAHHQITETDPEQPGLDAWIAACRDVWAMLDGFGLHVYEFAWPGIAGGSEIDRERFIKTLDREFARIARIKPDMPVWLDEANIVKGDDVDQMRACISMASILEDKGRPYHKRAEFFCPFVANGDPGNPPAWPPNFLIRDRAAYTLLGEWMAQ